MAGLRQDFLESNSCPNTIEMTILTLSWQLCRAGA
jgi:hypothetical protein